MCQGIKVSRFLIVLYSLFLFSLPAFADTPHDQQLVQLVHQFKASRANDEATRAQIKALIQKRRAWLKQNTRSAPSVAVQDGSWDGQVSAVVVDLADERGQITGTRDEYHLHLSTGSVRLLLIDGAPLGMQKNPRVHVEGVKVDNWIIPEKISPTNVPSASGAGIAATMALAAPACATTGDQKAIVIAVNWQDDTTASPAATTLNDRYFAPTQSLANYWTEASYGKLRLTGDTFGWFTVNIPTASACDSVLVRQKALEVVAPYTDLTTYNRIFLVMRNPTPGCGWAGLGELSCSTFTTPDGPMMAKTHWILSSYFNQPNLAVWLAAHEAGHNLGLHHAAVRDYGANAIGPVGGSNSGQLVEYGDRYDSMGTYTAPNHYNANHKYNLGWLTDADIVPVNGNRTVLLEPMSTPITGIKATRIYRGVDPTYFTKEYLWLETRQPKGYDAFMDARGYGSIIVHHQTATSGIKTENLDLHPSISTAVSDYLDAPLASGESFTDPYSLIKITHAGVDASGKVTTVITQDAGKIDTDEDGLPNSVEALYGSNPNLVDTDGDGVTDYREVCYDGDCLHYNPAPAGGDINLLKSDTDGDGLDRKSVV